ncbi:MAG TPA: tRNA methyltransferase, partial [Candidatus Syntrophosphaera sp.]|nr:tRNA methyltransferase [Candidatus Syntrophosphaera sp.]
RCHIPANPKFPSLNLAQAVTVALWELRRLPLAEPAQTKLSSVSGNELDKIKAYMLDVMQATGFFRSHETTNWELFLDKMLAQLNPSKTMLWRFRQMFNRWHVLVTGRGRGYDRVENHSGDDTETKT